jgi:DNA sulfur modification protein DndD
MILDELVLHNVGTFAGRQSVQFTIVGGLNGSGKTTLLEAIHLALYGALAQPSRRHRGSYETYLRGLIHHGVSAKVGATVELEFHAHREGSRRTYRVIRSWQESTSGVREALDVLVDGHSDPTLTATWSEQVDTFLPRGIAGLFFFDGEQIEALADIDRSRQVLDSALAALLGLDLVDRLSTDLAVLRRRHRSQNLPNDLRELVEERQRVVTAARQAEEDATAGEAELRASLELATKRLHKAAERYRSAGGDLVGQRETAEAQVVVHRAGLARLDEELREIAGGVAPLLQVRRALEDLAGQSAREAAAASQQLVLNEIQQRDASVLDHLQAAGANASIFKKVQAFLEADRAERLLASDVPAIVELGDPAATFYLLAESLPAVDQRVTQLLADRVALLGRIDDADRMVAAIPDPESLESLLEGRRDAQLLVDRAAAALANADERASSLHAERARAENAYESAMDRAANQSLAADDDRRLVDHADRVRETLQALKIATTRRHLDRISRYVLEALTQLMRKQTLVADVSIDAETYTLELTHSSGRLVDAQELSAGERQLLAVALLWGLARASGQPLPVVIDTPLGRLDSSHRQHLLDRYFPFASHQVILLSTDTEIDKEAQKRLSNHVGHAYHLDFDAERGATTIAPGYFWRD